MFQGVPSGLPLTLLKPPAKDDFNTWSTDDDDSTGTYTPSDNGLSQYSSSDNKWQATSECEDHDFDVQGEPLPKISSEQKTAATTPKQHCPSLMQYCTIKNTFIEIEAPVDVGMRRSFSCPAIIAPLMSNVARIAALHMLNQCRPCAYFVLKEDGCRLGAGCRFCHLCTTKDSKRRRKERAKAAKLRWAAKNQDSKEGVDDQIAGDAGSDAECEVSQNYQ